MYEMCYTNNISLPALPNAYSTCLENNLLAPNTCSLQVNEGSHLLGPGMLSNEAVTGLTERQSKKAKKQRVRERVSKNAAEKIRKTERDETFIMKMTIQRGEDRLVPKCKIYVLVAAFYLKDIFLCPIKEEDNSMMKRSRLVGQRVEDFQHHCTAHCIITGT